MRIESYCSTLYFLLPTAVIMVEASSTWQANLQRVICRQRTTQRPVDSREFPHSFCQLTYVSMPDDFAVAVGLNQSLSGMCCTNRSVFP